MTGGRAGRLIVLFAVGSLLGCGDTKRGEADAVLRALDVARAAPNDGKADLVDKLAHTACSAEDVCRARDLCADALRHLVAGVATQQRVQDELRKLAPEAGVGLERVRALDAELDRADAELTAARAALAPCEAAASLVRRVHRI